MQEKDELYWKVLNSAVTLDIRQGHLKWKISELARASRVSRTLIYYYFGKQKGAILREAVRLFGDELSGATPERLAMWREGRFKEAIAGNRDLLTKIPAIVPFYFLNRAAKTEIGAAIREREGGFFKKIEGLHPGLSEPEKRGLYALFFGVLFVPDMPYAGATEGIDLIMEILSA